MLRASRPNPCLLFTLGGALCLCLSTSVVAQRATDAPPRESADGPRRVIDPAVGDTGPLSESLRLLDTGLGLPGSFESVQSVPGHEELYMRVAGGLYAVFPRSLYVPTRFGDLPIIPNDTIFHIGPPPMLSEAMPVRTLPEEYLKPVSIGSGSRMLPTSGEGRSAEPPQPGDDGFLPSIAEATGYRSARLLELMRRAGAASDPARNAPRDH